MQREEIKNALTLVFRDVLGAGVPPLREEMTAADVKGWDSLTHVTLIFATEKRFGVKFSTREVQALKNVGELVSLIEQKRR